MNALPDRSEPEALEARLERAISALTGALETILELKEENSRQQARIVDLEGESQIDHLDHLNDSEVGYL